MLYWSLICFLVSITSALFGFGLVAEGFETIGMIGFVVFLVLFLISLVAAGERERRDIRTVTPDQVIDDDPMVREAVSRAWNSGKFVVANRNDDGTFSITEHE